jgi:peptidyl-tRNA hydrolase, PTH1 family
MKLVVGLGNPGMKYVGTRHNAGFQVLFSLLERLGEVPKEKFKGTFAKCRVGGEVVGLLMPQTYMNRSGESVRLALDFFDVSPEDVIVVHDELDLPLGRVKVKRAGGHGGHNGLRSITSHIGADYIRVRCGIGRPPNGNVTGFVLGRFSSEEREWSDSLGSDGADAVEAIVRNGVQAAMNVINSAQ